jgi:uncharacterized OB-fold protein
MEWYEVPKVDGQYRGNIYSWERVWHPADAAFEGAVPYVVLLVEIPTTDGIRMIGNLVGDQLAVVRIGSEVVAVFEHHDSYALVQWRLG